ncbi:unnamed protein product [Mytilus edulis]|uniref:Uncharacterized protein n=1 Tax=Mytilus edulis TaxID=6550 RepID=A0A8S3VE11_MYTED|nr:unnamed protein product [Mytilus edulis]
MTFETKNATPDLSLTRKDSIFDSSTPLEIDIKLLSIESSQDMIGANGYKYVFQPNLNRATCSLTRYQPIIFDTIGNSDCIFLKSFCNSEGQMTFENGSTKSDRTCICNSYQGFAFLNNTKNEIYCNPSNEDCSCFLSIQPNSTTIEVKGGV